MMVYITITKIGLNVLMLLSTADKTAIVICFIVIIITLCEGVCVGFHLVVELDQ